MITIERTEPELRRCIAEAEEERLQTKDMLRDELLFGSHNPRSVARLKMSIREIEEKIFDYEDMIYIMRNNSLSLTPSVDMTV